MDIEDFLRDNVAIETHTCDSDPVNDSCWFISSDFQTPECEEDNNWINNHRKIREWNIKYHRIWMHDNIGTRKSRVDITPTSDRDSCDWMEELVGL